MLARNPEAQRLHDEGLQAELSGNFALAHSSFYEALNLLDDDPATFDVAVQTARVMRDNGFTYVRASIAANDPEKLDQARTTLERSGDLTEELVGGVRVLDFELAPPHGTPKQARHEARAEHGATIGLLGRLATVREVMLGIDTRVNIVDEAKAKLAKELRLGEQQHYGNAHDHLVMGNNGYYRVSNAMSAARQERLNGRLPQMAVWLGRATRSLAWTAVHDRSHLAGAVKTYVGRMPYLRSYEAARQSVLVKP